MSDAEPIRIPEASRQLGMSIEALYELIEQGRIPYSRDNEHRMLTIQRADLEAFRAAART